MAKNKAPDGQVKARVLTGCVFGAANEVVLLDSAVADAGVTDGVLDTTAEAVAYAESIAAPEAE